MSYIMKNINTSRGRIIRDARCKLGLTPEQLAKIAGVSRISILYWEKGKPLKADNLEKLAAALGIEISQLQRGEALGEKKGLIYKEKSDTSYFPTNLPVRETEKPDTIKFLPIFNYYQQIVKWVNHPTISGQSRVLPFQMSLVKEKLSDRTFLFEIQGSAMVNPQNPNSGLGPGELAIVDPDLRHDVLPEDIVLAKFGADDVRLRQYQEDGKDRLLKAFDPQFPIVNISSGIQIIGRVVGTCTFKPIGRRSLHPLS